MRAPLVASLAAGVALAWPAMASADPVTDPVTETVDEVLASSAPDWGSAPAAGETAGATGSGAAGPSRPPSAPVSDDDSPGHETEDPAPPDHGSAQVIDADLGGDDSADVAESSGTVADDDSTSGDATVLALGGEEVIGAHAGSGGTEEAHEGDPLAPLCAGSQGQVCLRILYADAWATDDGSTSHAESQSGVAAACLGGGSADPAADCDGPVWAGAGQSHAESERDQNSGRTTANSSSSVADADLGEGQVTAGAVQSRGEADSGSSPGTASRESTVADLAVAGTPVEGEISDPFTLATPPGCTAPSLVCVFANQGETFIGEGIAGHAQEALHVEALDGAILTQTGTSETLVHNDGGEDGPGDPEGPGGPSGPGIPGPAGGGGGGVAGGGGLTGAAAVEAGALPNTGGPAVGLLALALFAISGGAFLVASSRRRSLS